MDGIELCLLIDGFGGILAVALLPTKHPLFFH